MTPAAVDFAGALEDARCGEVTKRVLDAVLRTATAVAHLGGLPGPYGQHRWNHHDVDDLAGDFLAQPARVVAVAALAGSGEDCVGRFKKGLETAVRRAAIDRLRQEPRGVLRRRIDRRIARREDVADVPPSHWALDLYVGVDHWDGRREPLERAAGAVEVEQPEERGGRQKAAMACTTASLDAVCTAVLERAQSPVERGLVTTVVATRIIPHDQDAVAAAPDGPEPPAPAVVPAEDQEVRLIAEAIWASLDDADRWLLPRIKVPSRELEAQGALGLGRSAINVRQTRLKDRLRQLLAGVPDQALVIRELLELASAFDRTMR